LLPLDATRRAVQEFGGFSAKVDGDVPTSGYMVAQSRGSTEGQITAEQFFGPDGEDYLYDFMVANAKQFDSDPNVYLGIWHDKKHGKVVIDVAHNVQDRDSAVLMAEYQSQISIWDVVNQEEIETGGTGGYAEPAVRPPDQEDLGDDGGGTAGVGAPDDQQRPSSRRPPPIGPTRPVVARSSLSTVDPADYATVNNGGGTLVDPVHVYDYEATKESTDEKTGIVTPARPARSLTVRQSDVAKHYRDVVEAAINRGEKANVKASEEAIAAARLWYQTAQDNAKRIQKTYNKKYPEANLTLLEVAGVIAAVSPRQRWDQNLISAEKVIDAYLGRKTASLANLKDETGAGLRENVEIALKILDTHADPDVMSGLKRKSFWNNLMDPQGNDFDVTIDGWMASAIWRMGGTFSDGTPVDEKALAWIDHTTKRDGVQVIDGAGYIILADAVRDVARDLNLLPHEVQAIYWVAVGGGQTNTQMWSDEPKRTGPLPGYNSKGEATMTKWDDDTLWYRNHPKAQRYRYANFHVTYQQTDVPGTRKGWWIEDPLERSIPMKSTGNTGTGHRRWFKTKAEAIAYMDHTRRLGRSLGAGRTRTRGR
jgi:hypothetical protein